MSPAERLQEQKKTERRNQIRWRTQMITAKTHTVDTEDDENFGIDVDGEKIDMDGLTFLPVDNYLKGTELHPGEIGCFTDEKGIKPPVRILALKEPQEK